MTDGVTIAMDILGEDDVSEFVVVPDASDVRASGQECVQIAPGHEIQQAGKDAGVPNRPYSAAVHVLPCPGLHPGRCGLGWWFCPWWSTRHRCIGGELVSLMADEHIIWEGVFGERWKWSLHSLGARISGGGEIQGKRVRVDGRGIRVCEGWSPVWTRIHRTEGLHCMGRRKPGQYLVCLSDPVCL